MKRQQDSAVTPSLADRLERGVAPGWRPKVGDSIVGVIVDVDETLSTATEPPTLYPILTIARDGDGTEVAVHCFHDILKGEVAKNRPTVGDRIGIKYFGFPEGKRYALYRVVFERTVTPNYDAMVAEAQAALVEDDEDDEDDAGFGF